MTAIDLPDPDDPEYRGRLRAVFELGVKLSAEGSFDYAAQAFLQCVCKDPGNSVYLVSFLENLQKKFNNDKKGDTFTQFKTTSFRVQLKAALVDKDWPKVRQHALEILCVNPWDVEALVALARTCERHDTKLVCWRWAHEAIEDDPEVNRRSAVLARHGYQMLDSVPDPPAIARHESPAFARAWELERQGAWRDAIDAYWFLSFDDETAAGPALLGIVRCYMKLKQYRIAMLHVHEAIRRKSSDEVEREARYLLGRLSMILRGIDPG